MASEPQYQAPEPSPPPPAAPAPGRRRSYGMIGVVAVSALVGALAGAGATILTAQRLSQAASPAARNLVAPLAPITNTLTEESAVINVAASAGKSVVEIKTRVTSPDLFVQQTRQGIGSGFIVSSDGYIVTNNHVVEDATQLQVILRDQSKAYDARIVGTSPEDDVAVIKIDATGLPALTFGESHNLRVGQLAIAIGSPLGQQNSVTTGVVSALNRSLQVPDPLTGADETILNAIQTDAQINPGNSGGPLLNSAGQVIGVNFALEQAQAGPGLGFALDGDSARDVANQLIQTGHVNQPYLGVSYEPVDETAAATYNLAVGALVKQVATGSPADHAGIRVNDVIVQVSGQAIDDTHPLKDVLRQSHPGDQVSVMLKRGAQTLTVQVTLGTHP